MYVIYEPASKAEIRLQQITEDAQAANFLPAGSQYSDIISHPIEDKAAIPVIITESVYYQG